MPSIHSFILPFFYFFFPSQESVLRLDLARSGQKHGVRPAYEGTLSPRIQYIHTTPESSFHPTRPSTSHPHHYHHHHHHRHHQRLLPPLGPPGPRKAQLGTLPDPRRSRKITDYTDDAPLSIYLSIYLSAVHLSICGCMSCSELTEGGK